MTLAKKIAFNTLAQLVGRAVSFVLNAVAVIALIRYLGVDRYGSYVFITSFVLMFGFIGELGIPRVAVREITRSPADAGRIVTTSIVLRLGLSALAAALCAVAINLLSYPTETRLGVYVASALLLVEALKSLNVLFHAHLMLHYDAAVQVIMRTVDTALVLWLVATGGPLLALLAVPVASGLVSFCLMLVMVRAHFRVRFEMDWRALLPLFSQSLPIGISFFFALVFLKLDALLLQNMVGEDAVGIYGAAYKPVDYLFLVVAALFVNSVFPVLSQLYSTDAARFRQVFRRSFEALMGIIVPLAVAATVVGDELVELVYSSQFAASAMPLRLLMWAAVFMFAGFYLSTMLTAANRQRDVLLPNGVGAVINLALNLLLIPVWGYLGSAIAILITVFVVSVLLHEAARRHTGVTVDLAASGRLLLAGLSTGVVMLVARELHWVVALAAGGLAYLPLLFAWRVCTAADVRALLPGRFAAGSVG